MLLSLLISTIDERIERIGDLLLEPRSDVNYIVVHQFTELLYKQIPEELNREDVTVYQIPGKGLTRSRNFAISKSIGDISLIVDDDGTYCNEYLSLIIGVFHRELPDIALFKVRTPPGDPEYFSYPADKYKLSLERMHSPNSKEIAFITHKVRNIIKFDERFGLGSYLIGGEEFFFIRDSIEAGLKVVFYPYYIVNHPFESTVRTIPKYDKKRLNVEGATYARKYGWTAIPRILMRTLISLPDIIKSRENACRIFKALNAGCLYILLSGNAK